MMDYQQLSEKKRQLDTFRPLPPALIKNLDEWYSVELTYTSNAIEGNTLTRMETALVVEKGLTVGGKTLKEHLEATNHVAVLAWVSSFVSSGVALVPKQFIPDIFALILKGIDDDNAGFYRNVGVRIAGSTVVMPNPQKIPDLMDGFNSWLNQNHNLHPVEYAARAHYQLVSIHPFVDGNGRTARLLMNLLLMRAGYPPAIIRVEDRSVYLAALEQAQFGGLLDDYLRLIQQAVLSSLDIYLDAL